MKIMNPVLDKEIHEHIVKGIRASAGELALEDTREDEDEFLQTVIKMKPAFAKQGSEYEVIAELSALLYCSNIFLPKNKPGFPGWHGTATERVHQLIDGEIANYLDLDIRTDAGERVLIDLDIDTSNLQSEGYYLVYFTPMTKA